jgi:hypothetical protein
MTRAARSTLGLLGALFLAFGAAACAPPAMLFLNAHYKPSAIHRVALVDFEDHPSMVGSGKIVSGIFEKYLFLSDYSLVDRRQVAATLAQLNIPPNANLDLDSIRYLGQKLGVDALIFGQVTDFTDTSDRTVVETMTLEQSSPLYSHMDTVQNLSNGAIHVHQEVVSGYSTSTVDQPVQTTEVVDAHVGLTLRMVDVNTGEVLWSASSSAKGPHLDDASESVSAQIMRTLHDRLKSLG